MNKRKWTGIVKRLAAMALLWAVVGMAAGCSSLRLAPEPTPEDTLEEFEDAVNAMDVNGMLDCMSEDTVKAVTAGLDIFMNIAGAVTGVDLGISAEDLIAVSPLMQSMVGPYMAEEGQMPNVDFQMTETYIKGKKATVHFIEANSGEEMAINMEKEDDKWVITLDMVMLTAEDADRVIIAGEETEEEEPEPELSLADMLDSESLKALLTQVLELLK